MRDERYFCVLVSMNLLRRLLIRSSNIHEGKTFKTMSEAKFYDSVQQ